MCMSVAKFAAGGGSRSRPRPRPRLLLVVSVLTTVVRCTWQSCASVYGATPCSFLPALPGHTPHCAKPGLTYCEYPDLYPGERIRHLIQKWRYDHSTLLIDESRDEFSAYFYDGWGGGGDRYGGYGPVPSAGDGGFYPEPIYIPRPQFPAEAGLYGAPLPPNSTFGASASAGGAAPAHFRYTNDIPPSTSLQLPLPLYQPYRPTGALAGAAARFAPYSAQFTPIDAWSREDNFLGFSTRLRRAAAAGGGALRPRNGTEAAGASRRLRKRQAAGGLAGETLCPSRSQYIMPRAALNNKGNWMYVVNMPELDNRYTQLVKAETCSGQVCSGLCNLPSGYTSRCEQKYVQKRLVALEGGGNDLYTDVFWFPSCCVCTISR